LRELRQNRRLTIEELAEASGVSGRAIGDMERGRSRRPHRGTITALSQGLDLDEATHAHLLAAARAARPGAQPAEFVKASPYTLPRGVRDFVGREAELTALRALAREVTEGGTARTPFPTAPPAAVVSGSPGSGKTTLAVRLAEEPGASGCPDGAFLVDMRGLDERPLPAGQVVSGLLGSWGVADDVNGYLQVSCGVIRVLRAAGRAEAAVETYRGIRETLAEPRHRDRIPPNVREFTVLSAVYAVSFVHLDQGHWQEAADALRSIRGQFDARGWHKQAGKVHLHLAHALARLGERAEAAAEYRAVLVGEDRLPADIRDEARVGLAALTAGRPAPPTRFAQ
jgi:transcriptional regulator with XRE-family HTH domain